ncbi:hypothetical protein FBZ84_102260 [Azospirillum baldaniorum]|uniref:phage head spike fiber domain-containing protein n=1 Tax=Azospirillum baldaniorum TaxID=1064539 RepID=UPI0011AB07D5|nr:hypothetical protein [Azospirillum baldaniorum]TWA70710.1 hypothetical protein FBZ84_102260 [Azospirillum baldaniorum]
MSVFVAPSPRTYGVWPVEGALAVLDLNFRLMAALDGRVTVTRSGGGTFNGPTGTLLTAAADAPRFDYRRVGGVWVPAGLVVEPAPATNLSKAVSDAASWVDPLGNMVITRGVAGSPDGSSSSMSIYSATTGADRLVRETLTVANDAVTRVVSMFVNPGSGGSRFSIALGYSGGTTPITAVLYGDASNGSISTVTGSTQYGVDAAGGGYWRYWVALANNSSGNTSLRFDGRPFVNQAINEGTRVLWGPQVETGSTPTSFIPTTTASATRPAETVTLAVPSGSYDVLVQDWAGAEWRNAVAVSGSYSLTPRASMRHVGRVRFYPAGLLSAEAKTALQVPT